LQVFWKGWICVPQKAGYAFLKRLASDVTEDEAKLKARIKGRMNRFYKIADVDMSDGYQVRFAKRFALAYAAGLLAIDYSVVPWKRVLVKRCIRRCYKKASHRIAGPAESIETTAQKVLRARLKLSNRLLMELYMGLQPSLNTIYCGGDRYRSHQRAVFGGGPFSR
jgi:hypothetical protein